MPPGTTEADLQAFVASIRVRGAPPDELAAYARSDFRRFAYTLGLVPELPAGAAALELGANPYFTTFLLRQYTSLDLTCANYFATGSPPTGAHAVDYVDPLTGEAAAVDVRYDHFNVELDRFPYADASFEVVLFCEIIEHLTADPLAALREIRRVLKPGGTLILTTPNLARLENVARLMLGKNLYDPYSGYGPYGRHNREYTLRELRDLLAHAGFSIERAFSADVHPNPVARVLRWFRLEAIVAALRPADLGQYLFVRAGASGTPAPGRPAFLYRSYAGDD